MNVLILCHGNINRSALSEAVLKKHHPMCNVKSAGFVNPNRRAAKKMRDAAAARGYDLEEHRSQLVDFDMLRWADRVIYMDGGNMRRLTKLVEADPKADHEPPYSSVYGRPLRCLGDWADSPTHRIPDPAFMAKASEEFNRTVDLIIDCSYHLAKELIAE